MRIKQGTWCRFKDSFVTISVSTKGGFYVQIEPRVRTGLFHVYIINDAGNKELAGECSMPCKGKRQGWAMWRSRCFDSLPDAIDYFIDLCKQRAMMRLKIKCVL